ncbi:hypothetical protein Q9Q94_07650 [Uliginosibacterium sp. 31-16]|uniref:hypothetical protein n=1 Tax=Uliginosibacterium sp. 31-16 TaxID=3068315 RepID=UPI00273EC0A9|nr:hypothetical protein [Uliginosibacterium sp. 31-16]MDP5239400.1 hypothetical protein [Uliginosibacterium sp. 31-16]
MNTITGNCLTEMDRYGDEVLNANWLPQMLLSVLGLHAAPLPEREPPQPEPECDTEDFMRRLYRAQE